MIRFIAIFLIFLSTYCLASGNYGSFSDRSVILNQLYGKNSIETKYKEELIAKKLAPSHNCLFQQIKKGDIENVELILNAGVDPNQSYLGDYAIYIAAKENKFDILKLLYEKGAKLDRGFYSELYIAIKNKNNDMAQYLLDNGAKVNYKDAVSNNSILYMALKNKMYDLASEIIEKGAKADMPSLRYIKKHKLDYLVPQSKQD